MLRAPVGLLLLALLLTALLCTLLAAAALWLGLLMPNLTWTSELAPIKQGGAVMVSLLGGWVFAAAIGGGCVALCNALGATSSLLLASIATVALADILVIWLRKRGAKRFEVL